MHRKKLIEVSLPLDAINTASAKEMAIIAAGDSERLHLSPIGLHEETARQAEPTWRPAGLVPARLTGGTCVPYGLTSWGDLFTDRQSLALGTFSDLVRYVVQEVVVDMKNRDISESASAYAKAVATYLAFTVDYAANYWSVIATPADGFIRGTFARQALPMTWDFAEAPPFGETSGSWMAGIEWVAKAVGQLPARRLGGASQEDAATQSLSSGKLVSTDPPYYDNIAYADLSDFFYVWLRRSLRTIFPDLFSTLEVPKKEELVAARHRHDSKDQAEVFFLDGMLRAMRRLAEQTHAQFPVTIYYAFKQSESGGVWGVERTGWETFLAATIRAGFGVVGTWPIRTERKSRAVGIGANALASSIVLVCRKRPDDAPLATRRQFIDTLKSELPAALAHLQSGHIAPVDLAQAAIGPGMAVYTRYAKVVDATGNPVTVREALALINETLDEVLTAQEGDFDADTRWALAWFEQHGFEDGEYGDAETLSTAKNTTVFTLQTFGVLQSKGGQVRLLMPLALRPDWEPLAAARVSAWLNLHQLIRVHDAGGEQAAAAIVRQLGSVAETARELAYRLYAIAERTKRTREALWYNALVQSWPEIARLAREQPSEQAALLEPSV